MTTIYFVRHAHSTYTPDEFARSLSEKGMHDVAEITNLLIDEGIDIVTSSPYKRAVQTVKGIADYLGQDVVVSDDLRERTLTSEPAKDFTSAMETVWKNPAFAWEGGESNDQAQSRGVEALISLLRTYEGKKVVLGTHGNIMVLMLNYFDARYGYEFWKELDMPDIYKATFENNTLMSVEKLYKPQG